MWRRDRDEILQSLKRLEQGQRQVLRMLEWILDSQPRYKQRGVFYVPGGDMASAITSSAVGTTVQLVMTLIPPAGVTIPSGYTYVPVVASPEPTVTVSPAAEDVTGGVVPLSQQFLIADAATDTPNTTTLTVTATDPNGVALSTPITFQWTAASAPQVYTQSGVFYPAPAAAASFKK